MERACKYRRNGEESSREEDEVRKIHLGTTQGSYAEQLWIVVEQVDKSVGNGFKRHERLSREATFIFKASALSKQIQNNVITTSPLLENAG